MQPVNVLAKDFITRQSLDDYIKNELGDDIQVNRTTGHTISGTAEELKKLNLSTTSRVFGVKCVLLN